jgi:hypothetical protein
LQEVTIHNQDDLIAFLQEHVKGRKFPYRIRIIDGRDRSAEQNALMWQWAREVSTYTGYTPEEVQARWKGNFGIPLLCEDSEKYRELYGRIPWKEGDTESIYLMLEFLPVTSEMTVAQMTRFLDMVHNYHGQLGHKLTEPEALK